MKEKLDAFLVEFKQEAVLDAIQIKLSSNLALGITQSKVGGCSICPNRQKFQPTAKVNN